MRKKYVAGGSLKHQQGKKNNLCENPHCESCYYCSHEWPHPFCDYMTKEGKRRLTEPGVGCTKWRKKGKEGK